MQQPQHHCIRIERDGHVAHVWLNRPDKLNAVSLDLIDDLIETAQTIRRTADIRVVVLRGEGRSFCAGLDFKSVGKEPSRMRRYLLKFLRRDNRFQRCCLVWRDLPIPVIAVVRGHCLGAGLQLAMTADFRVAEPDAKFAVMEAKWGLVPDMSATITFPECLAMDHAKLLSMTADPVDADTALQYGLVTAVSDDPDALAAAWTARLLERSPDALSLTKRLFHRTWYRGERWSLLLETLYQLRLFRGRNHRVARKRGSGEQADYMPRDTR